MDKKLIREILKEYKDAKDWLELYEMRPEEGLGVSFEHGKGQNTHEFHSKTEDSVVDLEEDRPEYEQKKKIVEMVDKALNKLTKHERYIIKHKFNLVDDYYYRSYQPGKVPDVEIYSRDDFPYERRAFYQHKNSAYRKLSNLFTALL